MKKILSILLLVFVLSFTCISCDNRNNQETQDGNPAINIEGDKNNNGTEITSTFSKGLAYSVNSDGESCSITGMGTCTDTKLNIPDSIDGYIVKHIRDRAFQGCDSITEVIIPDSIISIGKYSFCACNNLLSVIFGENSNLDIFGDWSFQGCNNLDNITIPDRVTTIGESAFMNCNSFSNITIPKSVTTIKEEAFCVCVNLVSVTFEENSRIESIDSRAFAGCYKLVEVINKSSIGIIAGTRNNGEVAYYAKDVHTGESKIKDVNGYLFYTYDNINYLLAYKGSDTEIVLPEYYNGEEYIIYNYAFSCNPKIISVSIPDTIISIPYNAFYMCEITSVTIPATVKTISDDAFYMCKKLKNVIFKSDSQLTSIGKNAFGSCEALTSITIPATVKTIRDGAFYSCDNLENVFFADNSQLTSMSLSAFTYCDKLIYNTYDNAEYLGNATNPHLILVSATSSDFSSCTVNKSTRIILDKAFNNCRYLTSIIIPLSVESIGVDVFNTWADLTIYCEATSEPSSWSTTYWHGLHDVVWGYTDE